MADYFVQVRKTGEYMAPNVEAIHMRELFRLMSVLTKDDRFEEACRESEKEGSRKVCEVLVLHLTLEQAMDCLEVKKEDRVELERQIKEQLGE